MKGQILYHSWDYNMTIVDFYQVISETLKTVIIKKIGQKPVETGFLSGTTIADPDARTGKTYRAYKRINPKRETSFMHQVWVTVATHSICTHGMVNQNITTTVINAYKKKHYDYMLIIALLPPPLSPFEAGSGGQGHSLLNATCDCGGSYNKKLI